MWFLSYIRSVPAIYIFMWYGPAIILVCSITGLLRPVIVKPGAQRPLMTTVIATVLLIQSTWFLLERAHARLYPSFWGWDMTSYIFDLMFLALELMMIALACALLKMHQTALILLTIVAVSWIGINISVAFFSSSSPPGPVLDVLIFLIQPTVYALLGGYLWKLKKQGFLH